MAYQRLRQAVEQLDLTLEQRAQVDALIEGALDELRAQREQLIDLPPARRRQEMRRAMQELRQEVLGVLSDEQRQELRKLTPGSGPATAPRDGRRAGAGGLGVRGGQGAGGGPATREARGRAARGAGLDNRPRGQRRGGAGGAGENDSPLLRLSMVVGELDLSDEQRASAGSIIDETRAGLAELRPAIASGDEEARTQAATILRDARGQIHALLTPQQREILRERLSGAGGPGGAGGGRGRVAPRRAPPTTAPSSLAEPAGPAEGAAAPDVALQELTGQAVELSAIQGKAILLVFGSYSCPSFRERAAALDSLREQYLRRGLQVFVVYGREAHPQDEWEVPRNRADGVEVEQPADLDGRRELARLAQQQLGLATPILLDDMGDSAAAALGSGANSAYLISRQRTIVARQNWFEPGRLHEPIQATLRDSGD
jgi:Spy/CpxP family protein refolding chaperone